MSSITKVISFYDINCTYMKYFHQHIHNNPLLSIPSDLGIIPGISIWHVHGHQPECFPRYALLFIPGSSWVDGEIIETLWSALNIVSISAWGMTTPHRQEFLDFQMNDSNFMKMVQMCMIGIFLQCTLESLMWHVAKTLAQKLHAAKTSSASASASFNDLDSMLDECQWKAWVKEEWAAFQEHTANPCAMGVFELRLHEGEIMEGADTMYTDSRSPKCMESGIGSNKWQVSSRNHQSRGCYLDF